MSVSDTDVRAIYTGDGATTNFAIPFAFQSNSEIQVWLRDETDPDAITETLKTITTHYTLTGGPPVTTVVMNTAPTANQKVMVRRQVALTQSLDLQPTGVLPPVSLETAYDKLTLLAQQLDEKIQRALKFSVCSSYTDKDFPEPRADAIIKWNIGATALEAKTAEEIGGFGLTETPTDGVFGVTFSPSGITTNMIFEDALDLIEEFLEYRFASYEAVATTGTPITTLPTSYSVVHFTGSTATEVQGISSGSVSKRILIWNRSTAQVTIKHQDAGATAVNRVITPNGGDLIIAANWAVELCYDSVQSRWFVSNPGVAGAGSLIDNLTFVLDNTDNTIRLGFNVAGSTGTTTTLTTSQTTDRTVTLPDADTTLIGTTETANVTNKSFEDNSTYFYDNVDDTKKVQVQVSAVSTATTRTWTFPDADDIFVGRTVSQVLTNKSMEDSTFYIVDNGDNTKRVTFQVSPVTTSATRTYTVLDTDGFLALSDALLTVGSIPFVDASGRLDEDNAYFYWNNSDKRMRVGTGIDSFTLGGSLKGSAFTVSGQGGSNAYEIGFHKHSATLNPGVYFLRSRGSEASPSVVSDGDIIGGLEFVGYDGTDYEYGGYVRFEVDGTPGNNDMPARFIVAVSPDGSATPAEALRIDNAKLAKFSGNIQNEGYYTGLQMSTPANPSANYNRIYPKSDNKWYTLNSSGQEAQLGGGSLVVTGSRASPSAIVAGTGVAYSSGAGDRQLWFIEGSGGAVDVSANPQIAAGSTVGQELVLVGRNSTNTVLFEDGDGLDLSGPITMAASSVLTLVWDGTNWVEVNRR